jgi:ABC-type dipeptide/oligopeptide/nickel transport system permease component
MNLSRHIAQRTMLSVVSLFGAIVFTFFLTHMLPGNPVLVRAGYKIPETIKALEEQMGLDKPLPVQFKNYVVGIAQGDLGRSWFTGNPVTTDLKERLPASLELALFSTCLALAIGLPLGVISAVRRDSAWDHLSRVFGVVAISMPVFWLGLLLIYVFYYRFHLAPAPMGRFTTFADPPHKVTGLLTIDSLLTGDLGSFEDALRHLLLPGITLSLVVMVPIMRITRATMIEVMGQAYIRTARAAGLSSRQIIVQDALRNSMINILTISGMVLGYLIGGAVLVEKVFSWPGLGQYVWNAMLQNDYAAVQGFMLAVTTIYIVLNWAIDLLYSVIDPRVRV